MDDFATQDVEGIKIERERKYVIPNQTIADFISENLPEQIIIPIPKKSIKRVDSSVLELLNDILLGENQIGDEESITLHVHKQNGEKEIKKHRPNYYFDTTDKDLSNNNLSFNLRQRESDWAITIKLRNDKFITKGILEGIFERIEFTSIIDNELVNQSTSEDSINIENIINNKPDLKKTFDIRIKNHINNKPLIVSQSFTINSTRTIYPLINNGLIHISMDNIITEEGLKNIYEFEIEIKFGSTRSWLDTISIRAFDYICLVIITIIRKSIDSKLKNQLSMSDSEILSSNYLFNEITHLAKVERVRNISSSQIFFESFEGEGHDISIVAEYLAKMLTIEPLRELMPSIICPYLIYMPKTYSDVIPPYAADNGETSYISSKKSKRSKSSFSTIEMSEYRESLLETAVETFEHTISMAESNPSILFDPKVFTKVIARKLTESTYLIIFFFPVQNYDHINLLDNTQSIMRQLFNLVEKETAVDNIFEQIEVDCALICENLYAISSQQNKMLIQDITLFSIDKDNLLKTRNFLELRLLDAEIKLQKLVKNRYVLRKKGEREPLITIASMSQSTSDQLYIRLLSEKGLPITARLFITT